MQQLLSRTLPLILVALVQQHGAFACIWDSDTLAAERVRFPEIAHLISGAFARHSEEFHEWRLKQREQDIASGKALPERFDDLAVSQHKLGRHREAIETMKRKEDLLPGLYETSSNLGTFYIYTGELEEAVRWISKALSIKPDAHFGREKYQKWLVLWLLEKKTDPQIKRRLSPEGGDVGFAAHVARMLGGGRPTSANQLKPLTEAQRAEAIRGVSGMMYFADFNNPILLEALGDLLISGDLRSNAAHLAGLCYIHASMVAADAGEQQRLRELAVASGSLTMNFKIKDLESLMKSALKVGADHAETIRKDEIQWIAEGKDAAAEFHAKYYKD